MIRSTGEHLVVIAKSTNLFQIRNEAQKKHLSFVPNSIFAGCGEAGVKGRDERQRTAPLTPASPHGRFFMPLE
jgi:hypothetical protein